MKHTIDLQTVEFIHDSSQYLVDAHSDFSEQRSRQIRDALQKLEL